MKKRAFVTGGTCKDVVAMACLVINLKEVNPNLVDEVVIFHDGISISDQKKINSIFPTKFFEYKFPNYSPIYFSEEINKYFSPMVFCKYECLRLLNEYSVVIWSDYDVVLKSNLNEILEHTDENAKLLPTPPTKVESQFYTEIKNDYPAYDYEKTGICYSFFCFYDNFDYNTAYKYCIEQAKKIGIYLKFGEQGVFDLLLQDKNIKVVSLSPLYSVHPTATNYKDAYILHAYGHPKFWNGLDSSDWNKYYTTWITQYCGMKFPKQKKQNLILKILKCFIPYGLLILYEKIRIKKIFRKEIK